MKRYALYVFDLDGTLYRGSEPVPHAVDVVRTLVREGARVRYLTNNSGVTPEATTAKLAAMGFPVAPGEVYTTAMAAGHFCARHGIREAFVVGEPGLVSVLRSEGVEVVNATEAGSVGPFEGAMAPVTIVGICRTFTYALLDAALQQIRGGSRFIATNADVTYPMEGGRVQPGAGSLVAAVRACTNVQPQILGKPNPYLVEWILRDAGLSPRDALMVGDRIDTDINCGIAAGCDTYLVLTGVTEGPPTEQAFGADLRGLL
ncbi:MAG: HAD-IIA family hydrolase [Fimbriimonadaceae bacterium]|nr:HAD-IIA family hydrolase [Fimbriimonadaceae bacterium]